MKVKKAVSGGGHPLPPVDAGSQWVFRPGNIRSEPTTEQTPVGAAFVEVDGITIEITGAGESRSLIGMVRE